jgi:hypothetical protein
MSINRIEEDLLLNNTSDASSVETTAVETVADDTVPLTADEVSKSSLISLID